MAFTVPTLNDLLKRYRLAFRREMPGSDAAIWPNNVAVSAKVMAGAIFETFGFLSYIAKMPHAHLAPDLETLKRHGDEFGIPQLPAQPADGKIKLTTTGNLSVTLPAVFARLDGFQYFATAAGQVTGGGDLLIPVVASLDGAAGNALDGAQLTIVSGVTGDALAEVSGDIVGGADIEDMESYRARILFWKRYTPHAGTSADYVRWCREVSGVTRVFVEPLWAGPGSVRVFVLMDKLFANGIPDAPAIARVVSHIEAVRPAGAVVSIVAPTADPVNVQVTGLSPNTSVEQELVTASLREAFARLSRVAGDATPRPGLPFLATPFSFSRSWLWQAIANAAGEERHTVTVPAADVAVAAGHIPVLGTVSFVT